MLGSYRQDSFRACSGCKYLGCVFDKSSANGLECSRKVVSGRRVAGAIRSLVNARDVHLDCARVLLKTLFVPVLMYGSEKMLWKEKERFRIKARC